MKKYLNVLMALAIALLLAACGGSGGGGDSAGGGQEPSTDIGTYSIALKNQFFEVNQTVYDDFKVGKQLDGSTSTGLMGHNQEPQWRQHSQISNGVIIHNTLNQDNSIFYDITQNPAYVSQAPSDEKVYSTNDSKVFYEQIGSDENISYAIENNKIVKIVTSSQTGSNRVEIGLLPFELFGITQAQLDSEVNIYNNSVTPENHVNRMQYLHLNPIDVVGTFLMYGSAMKINEHIIFNLPTFAYSDLTNNAIGSSKQTINTLVLDTNSGEVQILQSRRMWNESYFIPLANVNGKVLAMEHYKDASETAKYVLYDLNFSDPQNLVFNLLSATDYFPTKVDGKTDIIGNVYGTSVAGTIEITDWDDNGLLEMVLHFRNYSAPYDPYQYYVNYENAELKLAYNQPDGELMLFHFFDDLTQSLTTSSSLRKAPSASSNVFMGFIGIDNYNSSYIGNPVVVHSNISSDTYDVIKKHLSSYQISYNHIQYDYTARNLLISLDSTVAELYTMVLNLDMTSLPDDPIVLPNTQAFGTCGDSYPGYLKDDPQLVGQCQMAYFYSCSKDLYKDAYRSKIPEFNLRIRTYCDILDGFANSTFDPKKECVPCQGY